MISCAADSSPSAATTRPRWPTSSDALGVGKGVFYWYFASKDELLSELLNRRTTICASASNRRSATKPIRCGASSSASARRSSWFHAHREYFAIIQFAATDETFAPVLARNREIAIADTIRHLKDGIVEGRSRDGDPEMLAQAIHGGVAELTHAYLLERDEPVDQVADGAVAFCLQRPPG